MLTETLQITVLDYCNVIVMYLCPDTVISLYRGGFHARCAKISSLYREYRYIKDRYIRVLFHTFYCNFCRDIAYLSLYQGYRYIDDHWIGVPLYIIFEILPTSTKMHSFLIYLALISRHW